MVKLVHQLHFGSILQVLNSVAIGGVGGSTIASLRGDANIEPETSQELEVGVDLRFVEKIGLELTYYNRNVQDLILSNGLYLLPVVFQEKQLT